jgi:hypothetical protein
LVVDPHCDRIQIRATQGMFQMINVVDYPYFPWLVDLDRLNPATKSVEGFSMPFTAAIDIENKPGVTTTSLARTSPESWLDRSPMVISPLENHPKPTDAVDGPFATAVLAEGKTNGAPDAKPARLIVFATSRFINGTFPPRQTNYSVFLNMLDWSIQEEALVSIRSKGITRRPIRQMADPVREFFKFLMLVALPVASIIAGISVWRFQKTRRALLPLQYREA